MITKDQAINANEFHNGECMKRIGPRGGEKVYISRWRRNGKTQTWKTRPDEWRVPVMYGLYGHDQIWHYEADKWHTAEDCVLVGVRHEGQEA